MAEPQIPAFAGRTRWTWVRDTPLRRFLETETGSATVLLAATLAALAWANVAPGSYSDVWHTPLSVQLGDAGITQDLGEWVNNGLMTFFFFVVGLEARREFDIGELRERRRVVLPVLAGIGGMVAAVALYLAFNAGRPSAYGWGIAMSTDTAFALGLLALVGPRFPERLRAFLLTVVVVDDILALVVIATVYTGDLQPRALGVAVALFVVVMVTVRLHIHNGLLYLALGTGSWVALYSSGVDPLVIGLAMGLLTYASPAERGDLERATDLFRLFREQPTSELARTARAGLNAALSPNDRLAGLFHPWTSYLIVPLFALANAGITLDGTALARAATSPITLGILVGYLVGKPTGILGVSWAVTVLSRGRLRPPVGWAAVSGAGTAAGIGFTVSLLIASLAFDGTDLTDAKAGILAAAVCAALLTWAVFRLATLLPPARRARALFGAAEPLVDLAVPPDPDRDHIRGPLDAPVTLVEYGDFECPYCGCAEPVVREVLAEAGDVAYVWRHLPLTDVHPHAQLAAEASEAAARQGRFWEMRDLLLAHQNALTKLDLIRYAAELGLDVDRFTDDLKRHVGAARIAEDVEQAAASGVVGTPTFFVNGRRHRGAYDATSLSQAVRAARERTLAL
jgi:Na+/H+ antiporter NhaA